MESLEELTRALTANPNTTITPEMLQVLSLVGKQFQKQNKQATKEAIEKEKQKQAYKPIKYCKKYLKNSKKIEKVFDLTSKFEIKGFKEEIRRFSWHGIEPYNTYLQGEKSHSIFKNNAVKLMKFILKISNIETQFGIVATNVKRGNTRFLLKTEHGFLSGKDADAYLRYIIVRKCVKPIYDLIGNHVQSMGNRCTLEDSLVSLSISQLLTSTSVDAMIDFLLKQSVDEKFSQCWMKGASINPEITDMIVKIPQELRTEVYANKLNRTQIDGFISDSSTTTSSDSDSSDSDSDID